MAPSFAGYCWDWACCCSPAFGGGRRGAPRQAPGNAELRESTAAPAARLRGIADPPTSRSPDADERGRDRAARVGRAAVRAAQHSHRRFRARAGARSAHDGGFRDVDLRRTSAPAACRRARGSAAPSAPGHARPGGGTDRRCSAPAARADRSGAAARGARRPENSDRLAAVTPQARQRERTAEDRHHSRLRGGRGALVRSGD